ncbi:MAG: hypothetical protein L0221_09945 [Chloroflexi bacterium]|nr:hypothetical protein [Chloroflexota bacterium]
MNRVLGVVSPAVVGLTLALSVVVPPGGHGTAGEAKGTLSHKGKVVALTRAYLVTGPDAVDPPKMVRPIILSEQDLGARVRASQTMSCASDGVMEGLVVDLDGGPRLNYWMTINDQLVQHSGTQPPAVLKASADEPTRLAGKLSFDDTASLGPKIDVEFDAMLVTEFKAAR